MIKRIARMVALPLLALAALASNAPPAGAAVAYSPNYDWMAGSFMAKANASGTNGCTSGIWLKAQAGPYSGSFFLGMAGHCVYSSPSNPTPMADYAKFYKRTLSQSNANWFDNTSVFRPGGSEWRYDIVIIGPFNWEAASDVVLDYCVAASPVCAGPGSGGSQAVTVANAAKRDAMSWAITPGLQSPDDVIGQDVCMTGVRMGTNCGLVYGKELFQSANGWVTPSYKTDMIDTGKCGARGGDSSGPVWLDFNWYTPKRAAVGGLILGGYSQTHTDARCYTGSGVTVLFDINWIGMDDIRAAFPIYDLRAANYTDGINECVC